jgi:hypothetical protein
MDCGEKWCAGLFSGEGVILAFLSTSLPSYSA